MFRVSTSQLDDSFHSSSAISKFFIVCVYVHMCVPEEEKYFNKKNNAVMFNYRYCIFDKVLKCNLQKKISKDREDLNNIINQFDPVGIYIILHPTPVEYTFFSNTHGTFINVEHILDHSKSLIKGSSHIL